MIVLQASSYSDSTFELYTQIILQTKILYVTSNEHFENTINLQIISSWNVKLLLI